MDQRSQSWSIIIFCFNEVSTIVSVIGSANDFLDTINCNDREIIVVDDGSSDGSDIEIINLKKTVACLKIIRHEKNKGIGEALRSGYLSALNENVVAIPADGQFDVNEMVPFAIVPPKTIISFYRKDNTVYSLKRNLLSLFNKLINQWILGIEMKDVNWVKIYRLDELKIVNLKLRSSLVCSEICAKLLLTGNKVVECNSVYHQRKSGTSKGVSSKVVFQAIKELVKLIWVITLFRLKKKNG